MGSDLELSSGITTEACAQCEDEIEFLDEVFIIQVVRVEVHEDMPTLMPLLDEHGDFLYEHYFLHFKCWEEIVYEHKEEMEDTPPVEDELGLIRCDVCGSSIREYETCAAVTCGEIHRSKRSPSGQGHGQDFISLGAPDVLCIHCISSINEYWITFWEGGVTQLNEGECLECQHARCWRAFDCGCTCHEEEEGE